MHLSFQDLRRWNSNGYYDTRFADGVDIDAGLFFSQPTSYFVLDNRIPEKSASSYTKLKTVASPTFLWVHRHVYAKLFTNFWNMRRQS